MDFENKNENIKRFNRTFEAYFKKRKENLEKSGLSEKTIDEMIRLEKEMFDLKVKSLETLSKSLAIIRSGSDSPGIKEGLKHLEGQFEELKKGIIVEIRMIEDYVKKYENPGN